ncbi:hypothetical protein KM043_010417 [Ampulex compressa]|nr:hypothetical protein KM043_010417 [Ampulex compressa]
MRGDDVRLMDAPASTKFFPERVGSAIAAPTKETDAMAEQRRLEGVRESNGEREDWIWQTRVVAGGRWRSFGLEEEEGYTMGGRDFRWCPKVGVVGLRMGNAEERQRRREEGGRKGERERE